MSSLPDAKGVQKPDGQWGTTLHRLTSRVAPTALGAARCAPTALPTPCSPLLAFFHPRLSTVSSPHRAGRPAGSPLPRWAQHAAPLPRSLLPHRSLLPAVFLPCPSVFIRGFFFLSAFIRVHPRFHSPGRPAGSPLPRWAQHAAPLPRSLLPAHRSLLFSSASIRGFIPLAWPGPAKAP